MRQYIYGQTVTGILYGERRRMMVIKQSEIWTKVCIGFSGHCTAHYSRVKTDSLLPMPHTGARS
ncbi:hypothetical protein G169_gp60 [Pseudomonas phage AF]|uniref:hypothetical protein n=1 Tax=Pseudomonas phage AF TaxID=1235689 RepID=UPI0002970E4F|nr:hypothetical protein G169_gp60 [Pseudomonas phage AF]AFV50673.1 hypothetical protein AF_060 [Pseudomonas phage AF]